MLCRGPPGCCRDPRPASVIHSPGSPGVRRFAKRFKFAVPRRGTGRVKTKTCLEGLPFLSFPPAVRGSPYPTAEAGISPFFRFFSIFFASKKTSKKTIVKKLLFSHFFAISARPGVDFWTFSVPKRIPGGYFFGVFSKTAISSKSRSRLGNNRIFEGRTVRKSVRRATPDGDGEKKRQKSLPAPSPDALFRLRARFLSILGSRPGPENRQKRPRSQYLVNFF